MSTERATTLVHSRDCAARCVSVPAPAGRQIHFPDRNAWEVQRRRALWRAAALRTGDVTTVVLDLGGVVISSLFESVSIPGFPGGPFQADPEYARVQRGELSERDYWHDVAKQSPEIDIGCLWRTCARLREEMLSATAAILSRLRVVGLTNDLAHFFGDEWLNHFPELGALDGVIEASKLGKPKPAPEAFRRAATEIGEAPRRCLCVDDHEVNLRGARQADMQTYFFDIRDPSSSISGLLKRLGIPAQEPPRVFRPPLGF